MGLTCALRKEQLTPIIPVDATFTTNPEMRQEAGLSAELGKGILSPRAGRPLR